GKKRSGQAQRRRGRSRSVRAVSADAPCLPGAALRAYFTPRSALASLAVAMESVCLPASWSFCASSSLASACFTLGSLAFILAAAPRPCLISTGQLLARATPLVTARPSATVVTAMSFFIVLSPLRVRSGLVALTLAVGARFPDGYRLRHGRRGGLDDVEM